MDEGLTRPLLTAALTVAAVSFLIARRDLPRWLAALIVLVRTAIPLAYFAWYFDGTWTLIDDVTYADQGELLLSLGMNPLRALVDPQLREYMKALSGGEHIVYLWWNLLAQSLFGADYSSAVFLNVVLTFVTGFVTVRILTELGFSERYRRGFLVFFLLQWDVVAWSSFVNLKDILVMTLTATGLYLLVRLSQRLQPQTLAAFAAVVVLFTYTRFYVPVLILSAFAGWLLLQWRDRRKYLLLPLIVTVGYLLTRPYFAELEYVETGGFLFGTIRFALTPQPWSIEENYTFLLLPSLFHWLLFIPSLFTAWHLWRHSRLARLLLVYLVLTISFYAMVPEVQGPRHRVQVTFILAWLQFHFLHGIADLRASARARARGAWAMTPVAAVDEAEEEEAPTALPSPEGSA